MRKYEAMFIIKPDLSENDKKSVLSQINEAIVKNDGNVSSANIWAEKKKLTFVIKKFHEGTYYLVNFTSGGDAIAKLNNIFKLNENILRVLITNVE
ncbi:MAG: 30S ribosomal protein S6 [Candidatus Omnitrophota bacterium]